MFFSRATAAVRAASAFAARRTFTTASSSTATPLRRGVSVGAAGIAGATLLGAYSYQKAVNNPIHNEASKTAAGTKGGIERTFIA
ncbi:hypothetical protein HDU76_010620, partial [Blyttiomyces sp. JEL0837]